MKQDRQINRGNAHFLVEDARFSELLGQADWARLPDAVRRRFGKRVCGGGSVTYQGQVTKMALSPAGWMLAQLARLIGGPLPYDLGSLDQPAVVVVTEDIVGPGQFWIRQYGRKRGFPQVVHSSKRFAGPTGLEEYIGCGIGIALSLRVNGAVLEFVSDHYFISIRGRRLPLPSWLSPGELVIGHEDLGSGKFNFSLRLRHRVLGMLAAQDAIFQDAS